MNEQINFEEKNDEREKTILEKLRILETSLNNACQKNKEKIITNKEKRNINENK